MQSAFMSRGPRLINFGLMVRVCRGGSLFYIPFPPSPPSLRLRVENFVRVETRGGESRARGNYLQFYVYIDAMRAHAVQRRYETSNMYNTIRRVEIIRFAWIARSLPWKKKRRNYSLIKKTKKNKRETKSTKSNKTIDRKRRKKKIHTTERERKSDSLLARNC